MHTNSVIGTLEIVWVRSICEMRKTRENIDPAALRATASHGVIRVAQLVELGLSDGTAYRRCRGNGPWRRLLPGVLLLNNGTPTERQLIAAALLYSGRAAVLTGSAACRRHGIRRGPVHDIGTLHLLVPHDRRRRSVNFAVIERTHRMPEPVIRDGVPLAPVARSCIDAARRMSDVRAVTEILGDALQRNLCTVEELRKEIESCSPRGRAVPRVALGAVGEGVRSAAERDAKLLWRSTGLPAAWWNASVYDGAGRLLGVADAWCDDVALAWEINSVEFHIGPADYARTTERAARFAAAGVLLVPTLPSRIRREPAQVVAELKAAYRAAANRPRPPVHATAAAA